VDDRRDDRAERPERAFHERLVGEQRQREIRAEDERRREDHDQRAEDQGQDDRQRRDDGRVPGTAEVHAAPSAMIGGGPSRPPVAISSPTSSRVALRPSMTATSRPRYMTPMRSESSRTSSSSAEMSRTAVPASRLAMTWR